MPISMEALGHAVGSDYLRRLSSIVWCEDGLDAHIIEIFTCRVLKRTLQLRISIFSRENEGDMGEL